MLDGICLVGGWAGTMKCDEFERIDGWRWGNVRVDDVCGSVELV